MATLANDQMVQQLHIQQDAGLHEFGGEGDVRTRRRRITGWMVVHGDDRNRVVPDRIAEDLSDPDLGLIDASLVDGTDCQDPMLGIQQHRSKLLLIQGGHLDAYQVDNVVRRRDLGPLLGSKGRETDADFEGRFQLRRLGFAQTRG